ncbi:undecaprenyl-diphosphatase UppP [Candidatus Wolfebacteria bacterium RIFCSPHIGHO2_01_FULL_48_22]|uniref:Undecaprenyl-diphosphatase n=1 Tax=Candidatus Wolfebacteria bacterium RIFCSPHIGHO2_01_FULL_48_22 TaxID=1802555 RepID=A0A1F8DV85_9BACT|nr:MAG: undecaprenyl-diphosphatase UppP [Candidatus Wolfebacteria bacterium RIFCSPHIGHO2_01_FULL_48_22]
MTILHAIALGIVEGVTEFLPVSSTGHLILADKLLGIPNLEFLKSFEIAIQLGAIAAIVLLYWKKITHDWMYIKKIIWAGVPTFILGAAAYPFIKSHLLGNMSVVLVALFVGGVAILAIERWYKNRISNTVDRISPEITYKNAFFIGLFQAIAFIPGISRAAATILGGLLLKLDRKTAAEFSFLLAVPTMGAATGYDLLRSAGTITGDTLPLLAVGFITAAATAYMVVYYFVRYVQRHNFILFGWYRIALSVAFALFLLV